MLTWLLGGVMSRRASALVARIGRHLPATGAIADIGSGTGHNAEVVRRQTTLSVSEFDVADLHWVGPGPTMIERSRIPADDGAFDGVLLLFILQYPQSPLELLAEAGRVSRGPLIVLQSTYRGRWGRAVLTIREFVWGWLALKVAVALRVVQPAEYSLLPSRYFTRPDLLQLFDDAGLVVVNAQPAEWPGLCVSRDLYVLESRQP